ncbi:MAG: hypothetical protein DK306_001455 [Chloroflexi bacterium]|nr:MAG: hypothetical protein DK306_001455 [Chloroflexota bacterium]
MAGLPGRRPRAARSALRIPKPRLVAYVVLVILGSGVSLALTSLDPLQLGPMVSRDWVLWGALTVAAVLGQSTRSDLFGDSFVSLNFVPLFAIGLLLGPLMAGVAALISIGIAHAVARDPWFKLLFNAAAVAWAVVAAAWTFHLLASPIDGTGVEAQMLPGLAASLVAYAGNAGLVGGGGGDCDGPALCGGVDGEVSLAVPALPDVGGDWLRAGGLIRAAGVHWDGGVLRAGADAAAGGAAIHGAHARFGGAVAGRVSGDSRE